MQAFNTFLRYLYFFWSTNVSSNKKKFASPYAVSVFLNSSLKVNLIGFLFFAFQCEKTDYYILDYYRAFSPDVMAAISVPQNDKRVIKRRPSWCPKPILWELNSFLM